jgi:hypothetical protein
MYSTEFLDLSEAEDGNLVFHMAPLDEAVVTGEAMKEWWRM